MLLGYRKQVFLISLLALCACEKNKNSEEFTCSFVSPAINDILENDKPISLTVIASHDIDKVEFLLNEELIGTVHGFPATLTWIPKSRPGGVQTLKAIVDPFEFEKVILTMPVTFRYNEGENANGGTVFCMSDSGNHGLVVTAEDFIYNGIKDFIWGPEEFIGATDTLNGQANTSLLANTGILSTYLWNAFKFGYNYNGYTDWYVPSKTEMLILMEFAIGSGSMPTMQGTYWTSTECCRANACAINFEDQYAVTTLKADNLFRVRLIRKF